MMGIWRGELQLRTFGLGIDGNIIDARLFHADKFHINVFVFVHIVIVFPVTLSSGIRYYNFVFKNFTNLSASRKKNDWLLALFRKRSLNWMTDASKIWLTIEFEEFGNFCSHQKNLWISPKNKSKQRGRRKFFEQKFNFLV